MAAVAKTCKLMNQNTPSKTQYRATQLWKKMVQGFRSGMPVCKHRIRMKTYENSFTGIEAVQWLKEYLITSGLFPSVEQQQVYNLLQKFIECDVIEDCKVIKDKNGVRQRVQFEDSQHKVYRFVTCSAPLNFLGEDDEPVEASAVMVANIDDDGTSTCIANSFALKGDQSCLELESSSSSEKLTDEDSSHPVTMPTTSSSISQSDPVSPELLATLWKEHTLAKLLQLIELPSLDLVLDYDPVNGEVVSDNVTFSLRMQQHQLNQSDGDKIERDVVEDVPGWIRMAIKCLSNWPEGCPEDLTGGLPLYQGFEQDVLQSVITYFQSLSQPIIPSKLFNLFMTIHPYLYTNAPQATDALQLCCLLLPQQKRIQTHRLLRMIHKACRNTLLHLSEARNNEDVLLEQLSPLILRINGSGITAKQMVQRREVIGHMAEYYRRIFQIPMDINNTINREIDLIREGKLTHPNPVVPKFCQRLTSDEYERQKSNSSDKHLIELLGAIVRDENMSSKVKKKKLKMFQRAHPDLYIQYFPGTSTRTLH